MAQADPQAGGGARGSPQTGAASSIALVLSPGKNLEDMTKPELVKILAKIQLDASEHPTAKKKADAVRRIFSATPSDLESESPEVEKDFRRPAAACRLPSFLL